MTILTTHDCRFTTYDSKRVRENIMPCLKAIAVESQLEIKYN